MNQQYSLPASLSIIQRFKDQPFEPLAKDIDVYHLPTEISHLSTRHRPICLDACKAYWCIPEETSNTIV